MKKYFYSDGKNNHGPFTVEELKEKGITRETKVWFQELDEWKKAGTVEELNEIFAFTPPPINQPKDYGLQNTVSGNKFPMVEIFAFLAIVYWFIDYLASIIIRVLTDDLLRYDYYSYLTIGLNFLFMGIYIPLAISIQNKPLKIVAIILILFVAIYRSYNIVTIMMD